jgi:hypothetical protein
MAMDPALSYWPKQVLTLNCFFAIQNFIFQFHNYDLVRLVKVRFVMSSVVPQLVACFTVVQATHVQATPTS